eukprot:10366880-Ditylum_brightwellii.AAC.1
MSTKGKVKTEDNNTSAASVKKGKGGRKSFFYKKAKFTGKCEALRGNIFDVGDQMKVNKYLMTLKEISAYVGRVFKY